MHLAIYLSFFRVPGLSRQSCTPLPSTIWFGTENSKSTSTTYLFLNPTSGRLGDIQTAQTSGKNFGAATNFLKSALAVLGITSIPKLDLSFAGTGDFVFSFSNVSYASVDPAEIE
jgi:hypothetical protein